MSTHDRRKALLIGVNNYESVTKLGLGKQLDVSMMDEVLKEHADGTSNFIVETCLDPSNKKIEEELDAFFKRPCDYGVLYFSGHGRRVQQKGYICGRDTKINENYGVSMEYLLEKINASTIKELTVILDCCHAGEFANTDKDNTAYLQEVSKLRKGISILAATNSNDVAIESKGKGVFTSLLYEALQGATADILGHITAVGIYAYAESVLNPWQQRPVLKTSVDEMTPLRICASKLQVATLLKLDKAPFFEQKEDRIPLSGMYLGEKNIVQKILAFPEASKGIPVATLLKEQERLTTLAHFESVGLLQCTNGVTFSQAIIDGSECWLSAYGAYIWERVRKGMI